MNVNNNNNNNHHHHDNYLTWWRHTCLADDPSLTSCLTNNPHDLNHAGRISAAGYLRMCKSTCMNRFVTHAFRHCLFTLNTSKIYINLYHWDCHNDEGKNLPFGYSRLVQASRSTAHWGPWPTNLGSLPLVRRQTWKINRPILRATYGQQVECSSHSSHSKP